jgi:hypothetical protein
MMKTFSIAAAALLATACAEDASTGIPSEAPLQLRGGLVLATSDLGFPRAIPHAELQAIEKGEALARTISDENGGVDFEVPPGAIHFAIHAEGLPPARLFSNRPLTAAPDVWFGFAPGAERLDAIAAALDAARDPRLGVVELAISDEAHLGLPGAIVSLSSRGDDEPWAILQPDTTWAIGDVAGDTAGRASASVMAAANVRPGPATVQVTYDGETFPIAEIDVVAGGWTFVELRPAQ